ncbi:MAG: hypothetical protein K5872_03880 [Rhizobiaceae bacterium]|nr:hypothetical protein [Rhizobiaceae bacterium]MCV0405351.1 hypothetical protein [Rhizobiaceae bacterium]
MARLIIMLLAGYGAIKLGQRFVARIPDIEDHGVRRLDAMPADLADRAGDGVSGRPA